MLMFMTLRRPYPKEERGHRRRRTSSSSLFSMRFNQINSPSALMMDIQQIGCDFAYNTILEAQNFDSIRKQLDAQCTQITINQIQQLQYENLASQLNYTPKPCYISDPVVIKKAEKKHKTYYNVIEVFISIGLILFSIMCMLGLCEFSFKDVIYSAARITACYQLYLCLEEIDLWNLGKPSE